MTWVDVQAGDWNNDKSLDLAGRILEGGQWWTVSASSSSNDLACAAFLAAYSWENRKKPANAQTK